MGWRSDIARGVYRNLPRALMNRNLFPTVEVSCSQIVYRAQTAVQASHA